MQGDFGLLSGGCLSCCYCGCRLAAGRSRAGTLGEGLVELRAWNNGPVGSRRGADDGDASAGLSAQTHGHFGLGASRDSPGGWEG